MKFFVCGYRMDAILSIIFGKNHFPSGVIYPKKVTDCFSHCTLDKLAL